MFRADLFQGKRFLVTGGGTGLGRMMMEKFVELGADPQFGSPKEFAAYVADDKEKWARLAKEAGLSSE